MLITIFVFQHDFMAFLLLIGSLFFCCSIRAQELGCTDPSAKNFNSNATVNNGSCVYAKAKITPTSSWVLPSIMDETSGLVMIDSKLLTNNDDTDTNLYLFNPLTPFDYTVVPIPNVSNIDWEALAEDDEYLYIGDFGNNVGGNRYNLRIFKLLKKQLGLNPRIDTIQFSYELQHNFLPKAPNTTNFDCEAFIVRGGKIYLFTKEWSTQWTTLYELDTTTGMQVARFKDSIDVGGLITGATHFSSKSLVVLTGYTTTLQPFLYLLYDFSDDCFFAGNKRKLSLKLPFHQIEGIYTPNGLTYYVSNEKFDYDFVHVDAKVHAIQLDEYLKHFLSETH